MKISSSLLALAICAIASADSSFQAAVVDNHQRRLEDCTDFDFDFKPDGSRTTKGMFANEIWKSEGLIIKSHSNNHMPMLFDSGNPTGGDTDLKQSVGMVLIISEDNDQNDPDDNAAPGKLIFTFAEPVDMDSIGLLDLEEQGYIRFYDANGNQMGSRVTLPTMADKEIKRKTLNKQGISKMQVELAGSGAITDLQFCKPGGGSPGSCTKDDFQGECTSTSQCKNTLYQNKGAYDCKNSEGGVCFCGNNQVCGCISSPTPNPTSKPTPNPTSKPTTPRPTQKPTPAPTNAQTCPATEPNIGDACSFEEDLSCEYGEEVCCDGSEHPAMVLQCAGGTVQGFHTDACMAVQCECPDTQPNIGDSCSFQDTLECEYGEEVCCDGTEHASLVLQCDGGTVVGFNTDACMAVTCDPPTPAPTDGPDDTPSPTSPPGTQGDPHFKTHGGAMFDFHGGCDLVLLDNPSYMNGIGLTIHVRTKIETWWSYVESAVIKIGEETLEITGENQEEWMWLNGVANEDLENGKFSKAKLSGNLVRYMENVKGMTHNHEAHIHLGHGEKILFKTFQGFLKVQFINGSETTLGGSKGILGTYPEGKRVGRDGFSIIEDVNDYGMEWQVSASEPKLFHSYDAPWVVPAGQYCAMPSESAKKQALRRRRLEEGISREAAEEACSHLTGDDFTACVYDVIATQDSGMAGAW